MTASGMEKLAQDRWVQQYLAKLDAREVLDYYSAQNVSEQPGEGGTTELIHSCLIERVESHHSHGDANPSAALNVEKRFYICYAGGWHGNLFHLIMKLEGKETFSDSLLSVSELFHSGPSDVADFQKELAKVVSAPNAYATSDLSGYSTNVLNGFLWPTIHPYLEQRGITQDAADFLHLGYDERENRVVFPHFFRDKLVGFQKRVIPARPGEWPGTVPDFPKYRSSSGFPKAETLYGYDPARFALDTGFCSSVIVVESPFSVAKAYSLGLINVVATFGAKVSENQIRLLSDFPSVTLWFDDDEAGRLGERRVLESMAAQKRLQTVSVVAPDPGKDLGDYDTKNEVQQKIASAVPGFLKLAEYDTARSRG